MPTVIDGSAGVGFPGGGTQSKAAFPVGDDQTWQDVSASRVAGTSYQNTTGKTIMVNVGVPAAAARNLEMSANNSTWVTVGWSGSGSATTLSAVVPPGYFYRVLTAYTAGNWSELR